MKGGFTEGAILIAEAITAFILLQRLVTVLDLENAKVKFLWEISLYSILGYLKTVYCEIDCLLVCYNNL